MATYAAATNPFIKPREEQAGEDDQRLQQEAKRASVSAEANPDLIAGEENDPDKNESAEPSKEDPMAAQDQVEVEIPLTENNNHTSENSNDTNTNNEEKRMQPREEEDATEDQDELIPKVASNDSARNQHIELIKKLRLQLRDLERYAHERGELERVPASVLAERQTVILDTLRKKLPQFNLDKDKIEKLELDELKKQVDDEINNLIDPIITKGHLLNQLKTQLTDLERYISHLHGTIGITNGSCSSGLSTLAKKADCQCALHGCSAAAFHPSSSASSSSSSLHSSSVDDTTRQNSILSSDALPKTSRLIRGLMAQLICSDIKIQETIKMNKDFEKCRADLKDTNLNADGCKATKTHKAEGKNVITTKPPQFHDGAAWTLHIDRVILATDSLTNIYSLNGESAASGGNHVKQDQRIHPPNVDDSLVESVVRRQLVPALRDILSYGLIDPSSLPPRTSYASFIFDPYYLFSSLTCLPGTKTSNSDLNASSSTSTSEKVHIWHVIQDYYDFRNEPSFRNSSVKTLSQSFNLTPSIDGPIKITSKQALLIAIADIIERMEKCKPNGPESHFKLFVYTALNQGKLATWIRIVLRNKSIVRKYYHNFSFVCQPDKMDRFLAIIETLTKYGFKLNTDTESFDQFVSAF